MNGRRPEGEAEVKLSYGTRILIGMCLEKVLHEIKELGKISQKQTTLLKSRDTRK